MYFQIDGSNVRLLGVMHMVPADSPQMPDWISGAYEWSERLMLESNLPDWQRYVLLPSGQSLKDLLPADVYELFRAPWPAANPLALDRLKPWAAIISFAGAILPHAAGPDLQMFARVAGDKKLLSFLEDVGALAQTFDAFPLNGYMDQIRAAFSDPSVVRTNIRRVHTAWMARDLAALEQMIADSPLWKEPELRELMFNARNRAWMAKIGEAMGSTSRTLIAPGVMHLAGEEGLLRLLEKGGRSVSPVALA